MPIEIISYLRPTASQAGEDGSIWYLDQIAIQVAHKIFSAIAAVSLDNGMG